MTIEAMKQALEALDEVTGWTWAGPMRVMDEVEDAITSLRQAIAEAEKQEPVATIRTWHKFGDQHAEFLDWELGLDKLPDGEHTLYTHPKPKREPLTGEEIAEFFGVKAVDESFVEFVRAIEAAHGIKE